MSKIHKQRIIDPEAAKKQFEDDLAKMRVGRTGDDPAAPVRQRMLDKNFALDVSGFRFNQWSAELEEHQTLEQALDPTFWSDQVGRIMGHDRKRGRGDIIRVRKLSTGLYAELHIVEIATGYLRCELIKWSEPAQAKVADNAPLDLRWNVGTRSYDVIRKGDKAVMQTGFQTKDRAVAWIEDHLKKMAA